MQRWKVLYQDQWQELSAQHILSQFETGQLNSTHLLKAGDHAQSKPLASFIRELVWQARMEENQNNVSENVYFAMADIAPIPTALSDLGGRITYVNQAFCEFLGYTRDELVGMTVGMLSHHEDHGKEAQQGNQVIAGRSNSFQIEKRYICKDGRIKKGQASIALIHEDGQPYAVLAQIVDLTMHLELRQALIQAQSHTALGKVSQHVTHDLKNILMALKGTLDLLQSYEDSLEIAEQELINEALHMCDRGHHLIQSLLSFNPDAFQVLKPLVLNHWLDQLKPILQRLVFPYTLCLKFSSDMPIKANQELLERAIMNLCVNAKQALEEKKQMVTELTAEEQQITIQLEALTSTELDQTNKETYYMLSVVDHGIGMTPEIKDRILEPYFTTKSKVGGSGIGLANVWNACQQHHALLEIETEWLKGTTFTLTFKEYQQSL